MFNDGVLHNCRGSEKMDNLIMEIIGVVSKDESLSNGNL